MAAETLTPASNHSVSDSVDKALNGTLAPRQLLAISVAVFLLALVLGACFRFARLDLKPFHHDEGVNAYFLMPLAKDGSTAYKYNPNNYHGPTLYYITLTAVKLFGMTDFALRFWPCLFGLALIVLLWWWRDRLGLVGFAVAAVGIAISPGLIFFSRYFIHEMSFGFFSLGLAVGMWEYTRRRNFGWLALASICAGLLFATKETAMITAVVFFVAALCAALWDNARLLKREGQLSAGALLAALRADWSSVRPSLDHALSAIILFLFINVFFYSSAFTNWGGVSDAFKAVLHWTKERSGTDHVHAFDYYLGILFKYELPLLIGGLLAGLLIVWHGTRFWLFVGAWTFGLTLAYSLIPYKTPWLLVSFLIPLTLVAGFAAEQIFQLLPALSLRLGWCLLLGVALFASAQLAYEVNFEKYADNDNSAGYFANRLRAQKFKPYTDGQYGFVYAQTDKQFLEFVNTLQGLAERNPAQKATGVYLGSSEHWPLPWYMRDYPNVAYHGSLPTPLTAEAVSQPLLVVKADQQAAVEATGRWFSLGRSFTLRPGVELYIYQRMPK